MYECQFCSIPEATLTLQTKQFGLFGPNSFLCLLLSPPRLTATGLELGQEDAECFKILLTDEAKFKEALHLFCKCGHCGVLQAVKEEE